MERAGRCLPHRENDMHECTYTGDSRYLGKLFWMMRQQGGGMAGNEAVGGLAKAWELGSTLVRRKSQLLWNPTQI